MAGALRGEAQFAADLRVDSPHFGDFVLEARASLLFVLQLLLQARDVGPVRTGSARPATRVNNRDNLLRDGILGRDLLGVLLIDVCDCLGKFLWLLLLVEFGQILRRHNRFLLLISLGENLIHKLLSRLLVERLLQWHGLSDSQLRVGSLAATTAQTLSD